MLFRKRELTELCGKLDEFRKDPGEFAVAHKSYADKSSLSSLPGTPRPSEPKSSQGSVFETVLSETVFGPFPKEIGGGSFHQETSDESSFRSSFVAKLR